MIPPDNDLPGQVPRIKGFDPARKPRVVRMKDPEMAGRRDRTREGRERKRAREQRPKLFLIIGFGVVLITLVGLTVWNVLSRKADTEARSERARTMMNSRPDTQADTQLDSQLEPVPDASLEVEAKALLPEDRGEVVEPAVPAASAAPVRLTVSEKQRSLESARDRYLARPVAGTGDSKGAVEGRASDTAAEVDPESIDEAEKERVLRKVMPFYRSSKTRDAPPVAADELYIPEKK